MWVSALSAGKSGGVTERGGSFGGAEMEDDPELLDDGGAPDEPELGAGPCEEVGTPSPEGPGGGPGGLPRRFSP